MIDYEILGHSISHYSDYNFERIEAPWTVTQYVSNITKPIEAVDFKLLHNQKVLVGSGEQSFLYLYLKGFLPKGRFQTITPCYRYEEFDNLHTKYFMKNELIETKFVNSDSVDHLVEIATRFFIKYLKKISVEKTEQGFDINYEGSNGEKYELGSYGIRSCEFLDWVYGTGVAEPRLSSIIKLKEKWDTI